MVRFLSWFFGNLYTRWAWAYEFVAAAVSLNRWWAWAGTAASPFSKGRILEIGIGTGRILAETAGRVGGAVGIDQSAQMTKIAIDRVRNSGVDALIVRAQAQALPFEDNAFDGAYSSFPAEFAFRAETFHSIARVLQPGCEFSMVVMALIHESGPIARALRGLYLQTGQAGPPDAATWVSCIPECGLDIGAEVLNVRDADVVRIRALKPDP